MILDRVDAGHNVPDEFNVIIEIPAHSDPVKYEVDKETGALFVDRFVHTAMVYPANYGFVPNTLSEDGDPCDVLVVAQYPVVPGCVVRSRPIGALVMEDESGQDEKILAVPVSRLHPFYDEVNEYTDLPKILIDQIRHFFEHYKDLEEGKWVNVSGWGDKETARKLIMAAVARAAAHAAPVKGVA